MSVKRIKRKVKEKVVSEREEINRELSFNTFKSIMVRGLVGSTIQLDDGRKMLIRERDLNNIILTDRNSLILSNAIDVHHFIIGIEHPRVRASGRQ